MYIHIQTNPYAKIQASPASRMERGSKSFVMMNSIDMHAHSSSTIYRIEWGNRKLSLRSMCAMMPLLPLYLTRSLPPPTRPYLKLCPGLVRVWESLEERDGRAKSEDRARNRWPNCKLVQSRAPSFMWAAATNRLVAPSDRSKSLLPLLQMNSVQRSVAVADSAGLHSYSSFSVLFLFSLLISATRARPTIE